MIVCFKPDKGTYTAPDSARNASGFVACPSHMDGERVHAVPVGSDQNHATICHGWRIFYRHDPKDVN